jgi:hypothetical protein
MSKIFLAIFILAAIGAVGAVLYTQQQSALKQEDESHDFWRQIFGQNNNNATSTPDGNATSTPEENATTTSEITNFEQCMAAGYEVVGEEPNRKCIVSGSLAYLEIESCTAPTGEKLSIYDAQKIFDTGACALEGSTKGDFVCNKNTGTWWIDIQAYREGCNPACVINVATRKSEVNWRCTGALIPK